MIIHEKIANPDDIKIHIKVKRHVVVRVPDQVESQLILLYFRMPQTNTFMHIGHCPTCLQRIQYNVVSMREHTIG